MSDPMRSYDPMAYIVNNESDLDPEVVEAHHNNDEQKRKELLSRAKQEDFDVFICVDRHSHAFVLCAPCDSDAVNWRAAIYCLFAGKAYDPFDWVPDIQLCWRFELCYEDIRQRTYKIRKVFALFQNIKGKIKKTYHIGTYKSTADVALQFSALEAAPQRYSAILNDCVEFSKKFCEALLRYCDNRQHLKKQVMSQIKEVSATGLSLERMSRDVRALGWLGSLYLEWGENGYLSTVVVLFIVFIAAAIIYKYLI